MMKIPPALLFLTLLPALAHAEPTSVCQLLAESGSFELHQDGVKQNSYTTIEEATRVLRNMEEKGVCRHAPAPSFCELSSWRGTVYVDQITYGHRSPAFFSRDSHAASAYLAKLEKLGFCTVSENKGTCAISVDRLNGSGPYFAVEQHETGRDHSKALFSTAEEAIRWRAGLVEGKGCTIQPQALECNLKPVKHLISKDSYELALGPNSIELKDTAKALAARDALIAAKACVAPRARDDGETPSPIANGDNGSAL